MGERSYEVSGEWVEPAAGAVVDDPAAELEVQIAETREQMSETVQAIGEKLSPTNIVADAKETVREATIGKVEDVASAASGMANEMMNDPIGTVQVASAGIMDTIRANPLPAAIAAIGIAMLWRSRSQGDSGGRRGYYGGGAGRGYEYTSYGGGYAAGGYGGGYAAGGYGGGGYAGGGSGQSGSTFGRAGQTGRSIAGQAGGALGHVAGQATDTVGQVVGQAGETVGHVASQATETVGQVVGQAGETVGEVASRAGEAVGQVQQQAGQTVEGLTRQATTATRQAQTQLQRVFQQSPLVVGAAAVGVGALVATLLPNTEMEERLYGEPRDRLVEQAETVAQDALAKVEDQVQSLQSGSDGASAGYASSGYGSESGQTSGQTSPQTWGSSGSTGSLSEG